MTRLKKRVGEIIGTVMEKKRWIAPAPSISAASYISFGTPCSPARKMIIVLPPTAPQSATRISDGRAEAGSASQRGPWMPTWASR